jgi:predicted TIM-barrel fold metal-dependent hydrolase
VPEAPLEALRTYMSVTGVERVVVAHVSAAGRDMAVTLDAMDALGDRARGTMMPAEVLQASDLLGFHTRGMRGLRLSESFGYPVDLDTLIGCSRLIGDLPWHIAIWPANRRELDIIAALPADFPVPIVLDHLAARAWFPTERPDPAAFDQLLALLSSGRIWLKLSGSYRATEATYPWSPLLPHVAKLVSEASERLVWASDWPHVGVTTGNVPGSAELLDWLDDLNMSDGDRRRILVDTPAELFGFPPDVS